MNRNFLTYHFLEPVADWVPGFFVYKRRAALYRSLESYADRFVFPKPTVNTPPAPRAVQRENSIRFNQARSLMKNNRGVQRTDTIFMEDNKIVGVLVSKYQGALLLFEIEPSYYRQKQLASNPLPMLSGDFSPEERYLKLFDATLDLFQKYPVRLIVNEFEYAPFAYTSSANRQKYRDFMKTIRQRVAQRGISYIRLDFDRFTDENYYDNDHFNYHGAMRYSLMLSRKLIEVLAT